MSNAEELVKCLQQQIDLPINLDQLESQAYKIKVLTPEFGQITVYLDYTTKNFEVVYSIPSNGLIVKQNLGLGLEALDNDCFKLLSDLISEAGDQKVEADTSNLAVPTVSKLSYWDGWQKTMGQVYTQKIHPAVIKTIQQFSSSLPKSGALIDLFGGNGSFLLQLIRSHILNNYSYSLVDINQPALESALSKLQNFKQAHVLKATDLTKNLTKLNNINPNLVTLIGGICHQVVDRNSAIRLMEKVFVMLAPGGLCIVSGYTPVLLNAQDFNKIGFKVEQCSIPKNVLGRLAPYQMYVLKN